MAEALGAQAVGALIRTAHPATSWCFCVTAKDGIVPLEGGPETAVVGQGIIDQIRHMQGVVAVRPRLAQPQAQV